MKRIATIVILACGVAACSGGGGRTTPVVPALAGTGPSSSKTSAVALTITVPAAKTPSATRRPAYVSPATQSISVTTTGGSGQIFAIAASAPGCSNASGTLTCTFSVSAPVGSNEPIAISTFANTAGTGTPLSTATLTANVVAGQTNPVTATLNGVVASLSVTATPSALTPGTAATIPVAVNALDASGATIVGPGVYVDANGNPLTITLADSESTYTALSQTTITQPTSGITLSYNGCGNENAVTGVTLTASSGALPNLPGTLSIAKSQFIYLANFTGQNITAYPVCANGNVAPTRTITGPFYGFLQQEVLDADGYLYVSQEPTNGTAGTVAVYAPQATGNTGLVRAISIAGFHPFGLAIDNARHELYVSDQGTNGIDVFASGASPASGSTVLRTIAGSNTTISNQYGEDSSVAFDPVSGQIIFGNSGNKFLVFSQCYALPSCNIAPVRTFSFYPYFPQGSAVDPVTENYYVVDNGDSSLNVFAPTASGGSQPIYRIVGSNLTGATAVALDAGTNAYVSNYSTASTVGTAYDGAVTVFAPGANGNAVPIRTIIGTASGINRPNGIAVGP